MKVRTSWGDLSSFGARENKWCNTTLWGRLSPRAGLFTISSEVWNNRGLEKRNDFNTFGRCSCVLDSIHRINVSLYIWPSVCPFVCPCFCPSVCLSVRLSARTSVRRTVHQFVWPSFSLPVCVFLFVSPPFSSHCWIIYLSLCQFRPWVSILPPGRVPVCLVVRPSECLTTCLLVRLSMYVGPSVCLPVGALLYPSV